jgi:predicted amidophosphoribosyltransferase
MALLDQKPDFSEFAIVPVPLSKRRQRWRGYNQAEELAKYLAPIFNIPIKPDYLIRPKNTACQVGLASKQRQQNIAGAFSCPNPKKILSKNIAGRRCDYYRLHDRRMRPDVNR